jgi:iron complex outermembrane receptor protein
MSLKGLRLITEKVLTLALLSTLIGSTTVYAQNESNAAASTLADSSREQTPAGLGEIVVTAERRAEPEQDVPIAMDVLTSDDLRQLGVKSANDVLDQLVNVSEIQETQANYNYFIRGVGTADYQLNMIPSVGIYLDQVYLSSPYLTSFSLFDTERVEVLRGPQVSLYGRNTTGGAINFITRHPDPSEGINGYLTAGYGRNQEFDVQGALGVPLSDTTAIRVAVTSTTRDGIFHDVTTGTDEDTIDRQAGRAELLWKPDDDLSVLLNVHGGVSRSDGTPYRIVGFLNPTEQYTANGKPIPCDVPETQLSPLYSATCADASGFVRPNTSWSDVYNNVPFREGVTVAGSNAKVDWHWNSVTFSSITAYDYTAVQHGEDTDGSPSTLFMFFQDGTQGDYSQEFRVLSSSARRLRWLVGMYGFYEDEHDATATRRVPSIPPVGTVTIIPSTRVHQYDKLYSPYAKVDYDLRHNVTLSVGGRWNSESISGNDLAAVLCGGGTGGPPSCPYLNPDTYIGFKVLSQLPVLTSLPVAQLGLHQNTWGGHVGLDWKPKKGMLLYASVSRGIKSGGYSIAAEQAFEGLAAQPVQPEVLLAYEMGMKSQWMDHSLQLNTAAFYYDWTDLQSFEPLLNPATGVAEPQLLNVPKASLVGGELDADWIPARSWLVELALGLLHSRVDNSGLIAGVSKGNELPSTPHATLTGLLRKDIRVGSGELALQAIYRYQSWVTFDLGNSPALSEGGYGILNSRASYTFGPSGEYDISLWGDNLTDAKYCTSMSSLSGFADSNTCLLGDGYASYGISGAVRFGSAR